MCGFVLLLFHSMLYLEEGFVWYAWLVMNLISSSKNTFWYFVDMFPLEKTTNKDAVPSGEDKGNYKKTFKNDSR